jgi:hypothetical protein
METGIHARRWFTGASRSNLEKVVTLLSFPLFISCALIEIHGVCRVERKKEKTGKVYVGKSVRSNYHQSS